MRRSLDQQPIFALAKEERGHLIFQSDDGAAVHLFILEEDVIRVAVLPDGQWRLPQSWAIAPGTSDVPESGRSRLDLSGYTRPNYTKSIASDTLILETKDLRLTVKLHGFFCCWEMRKGADWAVIAEDRPTQAYNFGWWDDRVYHYLKRDPAEKYFGLGECSGDMDRAGRRIRLSNTDALGYGAKSSDPLYKHIPFYITYNTQNATAFGFFYDTVADAAFDFGAERSNYHGIYRHMVVDHGDLDYYVIAGPTIADVTRRFTWLTGRPAMMPHWALGYSGSTMSYTEAPDAQARMNDFLEKCAKHDILCESFHLSSGYTSIGGKRYVFHWNRDKFPDPKAFVAHYAAHGVKLIPNIKPCLLRDHPLFAEAAREHYFIANESGEPELVQFWGELGAYVDFTNLKAASWWRDNVTSALLDVGMAATWNDNNEYEIRSPDAKAHGFGTSRAAIEVKSVQTCLMLKASRDAQVAHAPEKRPFLVTRTGFAGMQRYAQTWSGDNPTSWESLKYNLKMGLGLALSGVSNTGHDVGGFSGPAPDPELFLRWVECGIFQPRFSIHSWNDDGTVNEPWMHESVTPHVRDLIKLRAHLTPYLYDLMWRSHIDYEPIVRPTIYDFPDDPRSFNENDEMMLGSAILVAPVVAPGQATRAVYLPKGSDWYAFWSEKIYAGGQEIEVPAPRGKPPFFVRAGSAIPVNLAEQHFAKPAYELGFRLFPAREATTSQTAVFDDDGESISYASGKFCEWKLISQTSPSKIELTLSRAGAYDPHQARAKVLIRSDEPREIAQTASSLPIDIVRNAPHRV